ncbi:MAG: hypothetical protein J1E34_07330 [Oscillospiraceae bacterium]|nr:hypothetical protein [Oscillospiraceae bacterium]
MKKYIFTAFLLLFWCVSAFFGEMRELILIAGFAAVLLSLLLIKKRVISLSLSAAVIIGESVFDIDFLLRLAPALILVFSHILAMGANEEKKKKTNSARDSVYSSVLFAGGISAAALIYDIIFSVRNPVSFAFSRMYWIFAGIAVYFVIFIFRFAKRAYKKSSYRVFLPVYVCAFLCFVFSAAGYLMNFVLYDLFFAFFPWLIFLAVIAASDDPLSVCSSEGFIGETTEFLSDGGKL